VTTQQGSLDLLQDPVAERLLHSTNVARLAYIWPDGTPRVVPIWFHWDGQEIVLGSLIGAPKIKALAQNPQVAVTIDDDSTSSPKVLLVRGKATVTIVDGVVPEYAAAAERYMGEEQGKAWAGQVAVLSPQMARIAIRPEWVGVQDFEQRFPNVLERAMARAQAGS
jgi:hypothetical protein